MIIIKPLSPSINMHLLHIVLHRFLMVLLERICSNINHNFSSLVIISLILMTCLFKQAVLFLGEIGWGSLLGFKNYGCGKVSRQTKGVENECTR